MKESKEGWQRQRLIGRPLEFLRALGGAHGPAKNALENLVASESKDVQDGIFLTPVHDLVPTKATVRSQADADFGEPMTKGLDDQLDLFQGTITGLMLTASQPGQHRPAAPKISRGG